MCYENLQTHRSQMRLKQNELSELTLSTDEFDNDRQPELVTLI